MDQGTNKEQENRTTNDSPLPKAAGQENSFIQEDITQYYNTLEPENMGPHRILKNVGWALFWFAVATLGSQFLLSNLIYYILLDFYNSSWFGIVLTAVTVAGIGFPVFYLAIRNVPNSKRGEVARLNFKQFLGLFFVSAALMYLSNYFSIIITFLLSWLTGNSILNPLEEVVTESNMFLNFAYIAIIGPIIEELIFRKVLLDKLRRFGDVPAILLTSFAFGFFHMNLSQFFYATILGIIFAYVTVRTNTIRYSIILHILINFIGSIVAPLAVFSGNEGWLILVSLWVIVSIILGLTMFFKNIKKVSLLKGSVQIGRKSEYFLHIGTLLFLLICVGMMVFVVIGY